MHGILIFVIVEEKYPFINWRWHLLGIAGVHGVGVEVIRLGKSTLGTRVMESRWPYAPNNVAVVVTIIVVVSTFVIRFIVI